MKVESKALTIEKNTSSVYEQLNHIQAFGNLLAKKALSVKFINDKTFSFKISEAIPEITLEQQSCPYPNILYKNKGGNINFSLFAHLKELSAEQTEISFLIEADVNPLMAMMLKPSIENFINSVVEKF